MNLEQLKDIAELTEKLVSLPVLVWIWAMVRANRKSIKDLCTHNTRGHAILHKRIDRMPCHRDDNTNPGLCPVEQEK